MTDSHQKSRWRSLPLIFAFAAAGALLGVIWLVSLLPVSTTGAAVYDLSRYGFALGVVVALLSLRLQPAREYGLGVAILGMLLGIWLGAIWAPVSPSPQRTSLFSLALGMAAVPSLGLFLANAVKRVRGGHGMAERTAAFPPRRFGMGTVMIVVLAVSFLFAAAKWLDVPPPISIWLCGFLGIIGGLQAWMNSVPRAVSVGTGAVLLPLTLLSYWTTIVANANPFLRSLVATPADTAFFAAHLMAIGAICGYMCGVVVAGLFLLIDLASRAIGSGRLADSSN